ncbi:hypothetical protein K7472_11590 [Streptomyces sp. PTM05]|uniref:Phosphodiesterase n=1 Tax=Streptantibioticus parmotrematis TaxID=2873249 RepID=A0ABS7QQL0_9ACTN|nr:hypothetical protein [Streptantibioticus parmotrematis]MBY8885489.1 hypothetical protein [Streptantibioticus parmotrematis]
MRQSLARRARRRSSAGRERLRFDGWIAGVGTASGTRVVVGHWTRSPFGAFTDVMVERADGTRTLLAPTTAVARFVADTYTFDEVRVVPVAVRGGPGGGWSVTAGPLDLRFATGRRGTLGTLLRAVPGALAVRPSWCALLDVPARLLAGVRTYGGAGGGRREWYAARDLLPITAARTTFDGVDLGALRPVVPPVRFGFGSTPPGPCLVRVTSTVAVPGTRATAAGERRRRP